MRQTLVRRPPDLPDLPDLLLRCSPSCVNMRMLKSDTGTSPIHSANIDNDHMVLMRFIVMLICLLGGTGSNNEGVSLASCHLIYRLRLYNPTSNTKS